ncbi:NAD(P)/FAD-dependent oxidoreductase [Sneathiella chinensis]|uniref:Oxidoreductase n=1 Tax=Sneathiella chinensis TaxID=349750 RepID=A0ABQ5UAW3_9PROT|nr:FAD-binding oxidoreductase [Sneathiella chinensis]GLQ07706.1 oxidoreductase [Sneathiella chinensis]
MGVREQAQEKPWWWEAAPLSEPNPDLPSSRVDVAIVGAGFTGLSAALTLGKAGLSVLVLDADRPGAGASSRNGGMVGYLLKPGLGGLIAAYGEDKAKAVYAEALQSVAFLKDRVQEEGIDCDLALSGRLYPAVLPKHLEAMAREAERRKTLLGTSEDVVSADACRDDVKSDLYVGGVRQLGTGGLHPAKYVKGMVSAVLAHNVRISAPNRVLAVHRRRQGFELVTEAGVVQADQVLLATNGYSGPVFPFLQRRVIPVGSTMIATEPLPEEQVRALFPTGRMITDSRKMLSYYRPSPDGRRVLLGGRPTVLPASPARQADALRRRLVEIFPELAGTGISHVWSGKVAYDFEALPTIGRQEGIWYALGYCGSGVAMSGYLGHKAALKILGHADGQTAFDDLPFPTRPWYRGTPWFLPFAMAGYQMRDRLRF